MGTPALSTETNVYYGQSASNMLAQTVILSVTLGGSITKANFADSIALAFRTYVAAQSTLVTLVAVQVGIPRQILFTPLLTYSPWAIYYLIEVSLPDVRLLAGHARHARGGAGENTPRLLLPMPLSPLA